MFSCSYIHTFSFLFSSFVLSSLLVSPLSSIFSFLCSSFFSLSFRFFDLFSSFSSLPSSLLLPLYWETLPQTVYITRKSAEIINGFYASIFSIATIVTTVTWNIQKYSRLFSVMKRRIKCYGKVELNNNNNGKKTERKSRNEKRSKKEWRK